MADERDGATGRDLEADGLEHRPVDVAEVDVLEGDGAGGGARRSRAPPRAVPRSGARRRGQRPRVRPLRHLQRCVEELVHAVAAGDGALGEAGEPADDLRRVDEHHQVAVEGHEGAERHLAVDDLPSAVVQQERHGQVGDEGDQRDVDGAHARRRHAGLEHAVAALAELHELVVLAREDAHDARAHDVLLRRLRDVGDLLLHVLQDRAQARAEAQRHEQQGRQERHGHQRQLPVQHEQQDHDRDHHHGVGAEEDEPVAEEHAHVLHVAHGAAHELPGGPAVEVAGRLAEQTRPQPVAQVVLDAEAHLAGGRAAGPIDTTRRTSAMPSRARP